MLPSLDITFNLLLMFSLLWSSWLPILNILPKVPDDEIEPDVPVTGHLMSLQGHNSAGVHHKTHDWSLMLGVDLPQPQR